MLGIILLKRKIDCLPGTHSMNLMHAVCMTKQHIYHIHNSIACITNYMCFVCLFQIPIISITHFMFDKILRAVTELYLSNRSKMYDSTKKVFEADFTHCYRFCVNIISWKTVRVILDHNYDSYKFHSTILPFTLIGE